MGQFLKLLFQIILSPTRGWEDVDEALLDRRLNVRSCYLSGFLPLIIIVSMAAFVGMLYTGGPDFLSALARCIIDFISLFLAYHLSIYIISSLMPKFIDPEYEDYGRDQRRLALTSMMSVAFVSLVFLVGNLIKVRLAFLDFVPLYAVLIIWKGCRFMGVSPRQEGLYMIVSSAAILGSVYLLSLVFSTLV